MIGQTATGVPEIFGKPTGIVPNINYDMTISIDRQSAEAVPSSGRHDGFPSYIIKFNGNSIYDHHQGNILELFGRGDEKINP
jgi:hypothetical protein